jgi:queuine/archaeosine tRNA-ribosyltransferase
VLVSVHNIRFYQRFMADIRLALAGGTFSEFRANDPRCGLGPAKEDGLHEEQT